VHPDKLPVHPDSTSAFQRLSQAYEILRKPSLRAHYDRESVASVYGRSQSFTEKSAFVGGDSTFRGAVESILNEFLHGDFELVRKLLEALNRQYPNVLNEEVIVAIERAFGRMRKLILTTRTYALLVSIELGRIHRVQKRLRSLGYLDVIGRMKLTMQLAKITLAVPVRVDRALMRKQECEWHAKEAGWNAAVVEDAEVQRRKGGYLLNERVSKVLEFIAGQSVEDEEEDNEWRRYWGEAPKAA